QTCALPIYGQGWTENGLTKPTPDRRGEHAMAFDEARGKTVLFGGQDIVFRTRNDTWEWDGSKWQEKKPLLAPSRRVRSAMAYDAARQRVVLFGGAERIVFAKPLDDTWEWDGRTWSQISAGTSP